VSSIRLIRHATLVLETSVGRVLVDPMLRAAGTSPPIENTPNQVPNPLVELPVPAGDVVEGVDLCIVTHLHGDHFDDLLSHDVPILTQPESAAELRRRGYEDVRTEHPQIAMTRGRHGTGAVGEAMGAVSGWVVDGIYVAGDTVWCDEVEAALAEHRPRATIVNAGGAHFVGSEPIVMDVTDVGRTRAAAGGEVVVVHLEAINHCVERRDAYRRVEGVTVPADGETLGL
jgi:L-ascorbate metabolism protein UlaG (beta-lactamase superfamily)